MGSVRLLCLAACLALVAGSVPPRTRMSNSLQNSLKPSHWLPAHELENLPSVNEITLKELESLTLQEAGSLLKKLYHLSQLNENLEADYTPDPSEIPAYIALPNGQKKGNKLTDIVANAKDVENFGNQEVTIFITGLPSQTETVTKANQKLVQAYMQRYYEQNPQQQSNNDQSNQHQSSNNQRRRQPNQNGKGNLIVIDLGSVLTFERYALLDVDQTGEEIGKILVQLKKELQVRPEDIHIVAQSIAAHVAGSAGLTFKAQTGHPVRRITALDPSELMQEKLNQLDGLVRGAAKYVDAIHTSCNSMGTKNRVGNVDFYPNGPNVGVPGARNVIEAVMRATRYFAESVIPGNEHNFPAIGAKSIQQYKKKDGYGKRIYMGVEADFAAQGDYILQVNPRAPFGRNAPAQKQNSYHNTQAWEQESQESEE